MQSGGFADGSQRGTESVEGAGRIEESAVEHFY